jgi:hypothetical protein
MEGQGSAGCGNHQFIPNSNNTSALPPKEKYLIKGMAVFPFKTTNKLASLEES